MVADMEVHVNPTTWTSTNIGIAISECPTCQQRRPMLSTWYDTIPQGDQMATLWQGDDIGPVYSGRASISFS